MTKGNARTPIEPLAEDAAEEGEDASLHDDLVAALADQAVAPDEDAPAAAAEQDDQDPAEAKGDDPELEAAPEGEAEPVAEAAEPKGVQAPAHWSEDDRTKFAALPDDNTRQTLLDWRKQIEAGADTKFKAAAEARKLHEDISLQLTPYAEAMKAENLTTRDMVMRLFAAERGLREDPVAGLLALTRDYARGVAGTSQARDLIQQMATALGVGAGAQPPKPGDAQADPNDPRQADFEALNARVTAFEQERENAKRRETQAAITAAQTKLQTFTEAKGEDGAPLHPHFERVRGAMALAVQTASQAGETLTLEDAYDRAVWMDPELRQEMTRAEQEKVAKQAAQARRDHAAKAGRARTPKAASVSGEAPSDQPLKDDLRDAYRDQEARARS